MVCFKNVTSGVLVLCICVSVQADYVYTTLDVPGASETYAYGIDGGNIVGVYSDGRGTHGFLATVVPLPATAWMALPLLAVGMLMACRRRRRRLRPM